MNFGMFLSGVLNFIIMAFVVFLIVKVMNRLFHGKEEPAAPTEKTCPFCKSKIPLEATRCPHCTSMLEIEGEDKKQNLKTELKNKIKNRMYQ